MSAPSISPAEAERNVDRAWDESSHWGRCAAASLIEGQDRNAREFAQRWAASGAWWHEACQQLRDVARMAS